MVLLKKGSVFAEVVFSLLVYEIATKLLGILKGISI